MAHANIVLPNLGFGMEEGRVLNWLKAPGDPVRKGEPVAEIESDKATVELEAVVDGVLDAILVPAEQVVPVGSILAHIRTKDAASAPAPAPTAAPNAEAPSGEFRSRRASPVAQRLAREHNIDLAAVAGSGPDGRVTQEDVQAVIARLAGSNGGTQKVMTAPAVRKLARDHQIDLTAIQGTGKEGRIRREDVESLLATRTTSPAVEPTADTVGKHEVPISAMRHAVARRLSQSVQEAPHFYTTAELDFTDAVAALPQGVNINALVLYLTVKALQSQPGLNATYEDGRLFHYDHVHLSMAVALADGLMNPVLHRADDYSLSGLAERARDLIERARSGKLKVDELSGGTFTVSNLGVVKQIERFTAIIDPPQVAILAVGAAVPRPLVIGGGLHIRTTAHVTLSADHRVIDGILAARFLEAFADHLAAMRPTH